MSRLFAEGVNDLITTPRPEDRSKILVVDMDGTLVKSDILAEWTIKLAITRPKSFIKLMLSNHTLLEKKVGIAKHFEYQAHLQPLNSKTTDLITEYRQNGAKIALATASVGHTALPLAAALEVFDEVHFSESANLKGKEKASLLVNLYGSGNFDYVGDSKADLPVWEAANVGYFAGNAGTWRRLRRKLHGKVHPLPSEKASTIWVRQMRLNHWVKNLLVFLPAVLAFETNPTDWVALILMFLSVGFMASSLYIVNDLLDLDSDRMHKVKKRRPMAAGDLAVSRGIIGVIVLVGISASIAFVSFSWAGLALVLTYGFGSFIYSIKLKTIPVVDIVTLACLYVYRLFVGSQVAQVDLSTWLILFSFFVFTSLGALKRASELKGILEGDQTESNSASKRGYSVTQLPFVRAFGVAIAVASLALLTIYVQEVFAIESNSDFLPLLLIPLVCIWLMNFWMDLERGSLDSDPVRHALKDGKSLALLTGMLIVYILSKGMVGI